MDKEQRKNQLPADWKWERLGDIANYLNGRAFKPTEWELIGKPIIRIQNLNNPDAKYNYTRNEFEKKYEVKKGDLLFAWSASLGAYIWKGEDAWLNQHIFKVVPNEGVDKLYLYYLLEEIVHVLYTQAHGSGMVHVTKGKFEGTHIPLPSLSIQQAVVSKIEELFSELDKGIESLRAAQQQLKVYRQSILKWAFEGKLTNDRVEEGSVPNGWRKLSLKELTIVISDGDHQPPPKSKSGIPFITISNVDKHSNKINFSETFFVSNEYYETLKEHRKPAKGDILYTVTGSFGIPILIDYDKEFCFQRHIGLIRPKDSANQKWLYYVLQSPEIWDQAKATATGTAQKTVSLNSIRNFQVPFCSIEEQYRIVQAIESRLSVADKLEETITQSLQQAESLKQSILKKAFEGKLI
ncbi:restriction endonuclease subunit S [Chitinophaga nivalis]|uniref:Restriction endonuclease subunit S n=1 Tax=Chitinophaga nivalis TaxID=2991709 RepID=A0ABT3IQ18_9BACT|nr:restriction endonuclease subunit S [Chitinophaga nivalis]MCW3464235.1 restriction endonuclease subunit S [Chitinophaga nivalis]MCW3486075.1 restriction endonuclease subunit S [Chitinophaga nivalis]